MTDYLEELEGADALLEATRRMEAVLEVLDRPRQGDGEGDDRETALWRKNSGGDQAALWEERQFREDGALALPEEGSVPLLEAVENMERKSAGGVSVREGRGRERELSGFRNGTRQREAWTPGGGRGMPSEQPLTAQQVDRAFRQDSRRYDGGFFLY